MLPVSSSHAVLSTSASWIGFYSATERTPAGSTSRTRMAPGSREEYEAIWDEWKKNAPAGGGEDRERAVKKLCQCLENNSPDLNLNNLNLSSLPPVFPAQIKRLAAGHNQLGQLSENLPENLQELRVDDNKLVTLPKALPEKLQYLSVNGNQLTSLPETLPEELQYLSANGNQLTSLPETLPEKLQYLSANGNQLTGLPETLPANLHCLDVDSNQLITLPETLPKDLVRLAVRNNKLQTLSDSIGQLPNYASIKVGGNPLTGQTLQKLQEVTADQAYSVFFTMLENEYSVPLRPLSKAVERWLPEREPGQWETIEKEQNAAAFSAFFSCLSGIICTPENPDLQIARWLERLAKTPELRKMTFAIAQDAITNHADRVILTYHNMRQAVLADDAASGVCDDKLPELISAGYEMFCLEQLGYIVHDKAKTSGYVHERGGYRVQERLRNELRLPITAKKKYFRDALPVTQEKLNAAAAKIKLNESSEFADWLAQWAPWKNTLQRINPEFAQNLLQQENTSIVLPRLCVDEKLRAGQRQSTDDAVRGQFGYRKLLYYKGFPGMSMSVLMVSVCTTVKNKGERLRYYKRP